MSANEGGTRKRKIVDDEHRMLVVSFFYQFMGAQSSVPEKVSSEYQLVPDHCKLYAYLFALDDQFYDEKHPGRGHCKFGLR